MADDSEISNSENRPFHRAYLVKKLPCPHVHCTAQLGGAFFEETGLVQHYRAKHTADRFRCYDKKNERQAWRLFRVKHGKETMQHVEWLSTFRQGDVCLPPSFLPTHLTLRSLSRYPSLPALSMKQLGMSQGTLCL